MFCAQIHSPLEFPLADVPHVGILSRLEIPEKFESTSLEIAGVMAAAADRFKN